ncbi:hypothetical protein O181_021353 [Austropuccinia psidii MF-1]|uniref:Uncharacterized protein n=1 Tax=Austropuccinia psidii MF-1 TaxID=1389203 RepID=A0A9Q3CD81_9BASI|nr:hypothetical protein [Austropuccinia psidii MF-1]
MTFTDESDLSETLSSAGSTIPLPSSELASRAVSEDPTSPSNFLISPTKNFNKFDRNHKKSKLIKSNINNNHKTPSSSSSSSSSLKFQNQLNQKDLKFKKFNNSNHSTTITSTSTITTTTTTTISTTLTTSFNQSIDSSSDSNHQILKSDSNSIQNFSKNQSNRLNPSNQSIDQKTLKSNLPKSSSSSSSSSLQSLHPLTSHGHLPLFEQPVLIQGARPRRTANLLPKKSSKIKSNRKVSSIGTNSKSIDLNNLNSSKLNSNDSMVETNENFKDDESSLTEQSSSDDEDSCINQQIISNHSNNLNQSDLNPSSFSIISQPINQSSLLSLNFSISPKLNQKLLSNDSLSHNQSCQLNSIKSINSKSQKSLKGSINLSIQSTPQPDQKLINGSCPDQNGHRDTSEESALTPEPEEDRQSVIHKSIPHPPIPIPHEFFSSSINQSHLTLSTSSTQISDQQEFKNSSSNFNLTSSQVVPYQSSQPNLIPPSTPKHQPQPKILSNQTTPGDQFTNKLESNSAPLLAPSTHLQLDDRSDPIFEHHTLEADLADDALDGEPILDDLMDYEMEFVDTLSGEPSFEIASNIREPSEAGTSAVDGVPVADSEDVVEEIELRPPVEPQLKSSKTSKFHSPTSPKTFTEPDPALDRLPEPDSNAEPEPEPDPKPQTKTDKPKSTRAILSEVIYEHDDHVRRREDALEAMVKIEIMFAQVRDRLYVERMADVNRETVAVEHGSHPELNEYYRMLEQKRDARLSLAQKIFNLKEIELNKKREAATHSVWTKWHEAKTGLHNSMIVETQKQMKQLEREKCQPDLRYNVEVQLLPRPIIPWTKKRNRSYKRTRLELDEGNEELLAVELHAAVAKRATVKLSTLTAEESWADLSVMRPQSKATTHLDPVNILFAHDNRLSSIRDDDLGSSMSTKPDGDELENSSKDLLLAPPKKLNSELITPFPSQSQPSSTFTRDFLKEFTRSVGSSNERTDGLSCSPSRIWRDYHLKTGFDSKSAVTCRTHQVSKSDRRPTLDAVIGHNTPERLKAHAKSSSCEAITHFGLQATCHGSSSCTIKQHSHHHSTTITNNVKHNHPAQLYPSVPISVNYH